MMKITHGDSIESIPRNAGEKSSRGRGRLVRSLEFTPSDKPIPRAAAAVSKSKKKSNKNTTIWRDPVKNFLSPSGGFTTHKMSSVTNNFMSDELETESEIDEVVEGMVGDLDPGRGTLVFTQHDEVFRSSPLSTSSSFINDDDGEEEEEIIDQTYKNNENCNITHADNINSFNVEPSAPSTCDVGMAWNPKQNKWVPLIYRYVFPISAFKESPSKTSSSSAAVTSRISWSLGNKSSLDNNKRSFTFPPPQKSIMMGPGGTIVDSDAREACEKLLELIDDENLMLPVRVSLRSSSPAVTITPQIPLLSANRAPLLSEWSSLPSSPPPPIFHDVCNRPIPELRLSPPLTGKSLGKRLFSTAAVVGNSNTPIATNTASPCESPLTKRLRFSSSSSSIVQ